MTILTEETKDWQIFCLNNFLREKAQIFRRCIVSTSSVHRHGFKTMGKEGISIQRNYDTLLVGDEQLSRYCENRLRKTSENIDNTKYLCKIQEN